MWAWIIAAALGTVPVEVVAQDAALIVERNHYYDQNGKHVFDQLIWYDFDPAQNRYQVRDWRLVREPEHAPVWDESRGCYRAVFMDGKTLRDVRACIYRETWTQYDPEIYEREYLPKDCRRGLAPLRCMRKVLHD